MLTCRSRHNTDYLMSSLFQYPILLPTVQFLTAVEYGNVLSTCQDAAEFDYDVIWKSFVPKCQYPMWRKHAAMLQELLRRYTLAQLMCEVTSVRRMRRLLRCSRSSQSLQKMKYQCSQYLKQPSRCKEFDSVVRMEILVMLGGYDGKCGMALKFHTHARHTIAIG